MNINRDIFIPWVFLIKGLYIWKIKFIDVSLCCHEIHIPSKITIFILMAKDIILATSNIGKDICNKFPATLELTNAMNEDT